MRSGRIAAALATVLIALCGEAGAVSNADEQIAGTVVVGDATLSFSCLGDPTCNGAYAARGKVAACTNEYTHGGTFTMFGVTLGQPATFSGTISLGNGRVDAVPGPGGACTYTFADTSIQYTATWDGKAGTITLQIGAFSFDGPFVSNATSTPQTFPMNVTASITPTTVNANALVQPRAQDQGRVGGIFVFAHAPASIVRNANASASDPCVLAQLRNDGTLIAVSPGTMQPYLTSLLSSDPQAVGVLSNIPTPNIAGATFEIGYGASATAMLANGVYQGVVTVPGTSQCRTALGVSAAPTSPVFTGLFWNANESGWGIHLTQRGLNTFAAWYTYDGAGKPKWYVATCNNSPGSTACTGTLFEVTGPNFFGGPFNPALVKPTAAGTLQLDVAVANTVTMRYTGVAGQARTVALTRQPLSGEATAPAIDYTDIWWNPSESGWGMAMAQQYGTSFLAWYVYDANGKPTWLVATCVMRGSSCSGTLYRTTGPPFGPTFNPSLVQATAAGTIAVNFTDANNAILDYTVDGVSATKSVTRQLF